MTRPRCAWCGTDPLYVDYHDREWGVPVHDDRHLFELLSRHLSQRLPQRAEPGETARSAR